MLTHGGIQVYVKTFQNIIIYEDQIYFSNRLIYNLQGFCAFLLRNWSYLHIAWSIVILMALISSTLTVLDLWSVLLSCIL